MISYPHLLQLALPEVILTLTALFLLAVDLLFLRRSTNRTRLISAALLGSIGCIAAALRLITATEQANVLHGVFLVNPLTRIVQLAILTLTVFTLLITVDTDFTDHIAEFVALILLATTGMMFLVATSDLLVIFIALELLSLSLYVLTAFNKHSERSAEAALKYFLFGGMSAAFLLFGFSFLYGLSNSTNLLQISFAVHHTGLTPLVVIAIVTTLIGFGFKVAAAPFHFWAPDVYQGAPTPAAAFTASASKVASFAIFFSIMGSAFAGVAGSAEWHHLANGWVPAVAAIAALSMVLGNVVALAQTSVRRLLAYSAVAHAGYMLLAIASHTEQSLTALIYYVFTYGLATIGLFAIVGIIEKEIGSDKLDNFNGLSRRAPLLALCLFIFILSLAGIPPLAGFFGKFYLFLAAINATSGSAGLLWLVILAIAMSAVSLFYYLQVLKRAYVTPAAENATPIKVPIVTQLVTIALAIAVLLAGCAPNLLLHWIDAAIRSTRM